MLVSNLQGGPNLISVKAFSSAWLFGGAACGFSCAWGCQASSAKLARLPGQLEAGRGTRGNGAKLPQKPHIRALGDNSRRRRQEILQYFSAFATNSKFYFLTARLT